MTSSPWSRLRSLGKGLVGVTFSKRRWGVFAETWDRSQFDSAFSISYSQYVEDLTLVHFLGYKGPGRYLDVGAHHPDRMSNTRILYDRGWRGVNVDANPQTRVPFEQRRPGDVFICALVGLPDGSRQREFFVFIEPGLSTADVAWRDNAVRAGEELSHSIMVPVVSLAELMTAHFQDSPPDLLLVDAEGSDYEVLRSNDWSAHRPAWVIVETPSGVAQSLASEPVAYLLDLGYEAVAILPLSTLMRDGSLGND